MDDELDVLAASPDLVRLLTHYARAEDREAWQGRVTELDGCTAAELVRLHGELIAGGWVEQNTGAARAEYRAMPAGVRAVRAVVREAKRQAA
jgi:hypothetical protein